MQTVFKRAGDLVARYGGEEFAVVLPATSAENALLVAERLRQAVWDRDMPHTQSRVADRITLSIGVATLSSGELTQTQKFTAMADEALYMAKANGRNRTEQHLVGRIPSPSIGLS